VSRRRERGLALVAAVSALAVLGVLALGLAHTSVVDQHLARNALAALQADALARSGVAAAAVLLREANAAGGSDNRGLATTSRISPAMEDRADAISST